MVHSRVSQAIPEHQVTCETELDISQVDISQVVIQLAAYCM